MRPILFSLLFISTTGLCQVGYGVVAGVDIFQHHIRPIERGFSFDSRSTGSVLLNPVLGPKVWIGNRSVSLSVEAQINWGMFALDIQEYKGLGALSFPLLTKLNFGALTGFNDIQIVGWSLGGGFQFTNNEIYYNLKEFEETDLGYFTTPFVELGFGAGISGADIQLYLRYGRGSNDNRIFHIGILADLNFSFLSRFENEQEKHQNRRRQRKTIKNSSRK